MTDAVTEALKDAPPPLPAEGVWSGNPADLPNWDAMPRRNRRRRRRGHYPIWLKYLGWVVGLAVLVTIGQIAFHAMRSDPRDATLYSLRQLRSSVLRPNPTSRGRRPRMRRAWSGHQRIPSRAAPRFSKSVRPYGAIAEASKALGNG